VAFFLFVTYLFLSFLRPGELYPWLAPYGVMDFASVLALGAAAVAVVAGRAPTWRLPQPYLMIAFALWAGLSILLALHWITGSIGVLVHMAPSLTIFVLFFLNLTSVARVRTTCAALLLLGVLVSAQSLYSYHTGWRARTFLFLQRLDDPTEEVVIPDSELNESGDALALPEQPAEPPADGTDPEASAAESSGPGYIVRVRSQGFLHDPNDLAQALVSFLPLALALRRPGRRWRNALLIWLPVAILLYTVALTRSRGALVALAALLYLGLKPRLGRTLSVLLGLAGAAAAIGFGFVGGRAMAVDDSAEGRLEAWAEGLEMLKSSPVWGVGYGQYTDYNTLVAHNSFVHCFAETGLVGYALWLALIVFTLRGLHAVWAAAPDGEAGEEFRRWSRAVQLSLSAFLVGAFFLSRTYGVMLFLLLGLGTAVASAADREDWHPPGDGTAAWALGAGALAIGSVFAFWLLMKMHA
jgi:putative inorganic carbon (hco3(-)) transporter